MTMIASMYRFGGCGVAVMVCVAVGVDGGPRVAECAR